MLKYSNNIVPLFSLKFLKSSSQTFEIINPLGFLGNFPSDNAYDIFHFHTPIEKIESVFLKIHNNLDINNYLQRIFIQIGEG